MRVAVAALSLAAGCSYVIREPQRLPPTHSLHCMPVGATFDTAVAAAGYGAAIFAVAASSGGGMSTLWLPYVGVPALVTALPFTFGAVHGWRDHVRCKALADSAPLEYAIAASAFADELAAAGDCAGVDRIAARVRHLDRGFFEQQFVHRPSLQVCIRALAQPTP